MERHHATALSQALDHLYLEGAVSILWVHLYLWFGAKRLSKGAYREIIRQWEELCVITYGHLSAPELVMLESDGPTFKLQRKTFQGEKVVPLANWA